MVQNPFKSFHPVPKCQALLDAAFSRASKRLKSPGSRATHLKKARTKEYSRVKLVVDYLVDRVTAIVKSVPNLAELQDFYRQLAHLLVDNDKLRQHLGKLQGIIPVLKQFRKRFGYRIRTAKTPHTAQAVRVEAYGRISSVVNQQATTLEFLEEVRRKLRKIPVFDPNAPAVAIAGYPNVGKSSIVRQISTGTPAVAEYPFTTKEISIGVMYNARAEDRFTRYKRFQVIDTPGILDRPMADRNSIEKQAILAFQALAELVVFVVDPTLTSGYELAPQLDLYREVVGLFGGADGIPVLPVINKVDLATPDQVEATRAALPRPEAIDGPVLAVDALHGTRLEQLADQIVACAKAHPHLRPDPATSRVLPGTLE